MTELTRLPDWRPRLHRFLDEARRQEFRYGEQDCALFVNDAVAAMTGTDLAAEFRGTYTTFEGGIRALRRAGFIDHVDFAAAHLREITPAVLAQVGDIAVVGSEDGDVLGLVGGARIFAWRADALVSLELTAIKRAFRI